MLQSELEEARGFAEEAARLRGQLADLETKLLFALKGAKAMEPLLPKVGWGGGGGGRGGSSREEAMAGGRGELALASDVGGIEECWRVRWSASGQ